MDGDGETTPGPPPAKAERDQWITLGTAAFGILANAVGVLDFATSHRLLLACLTGILGASVGTFWLLRNVDGGSAPGAGRQPLFLLNLAMMLIGAGLVGAAIAGWAHPNSSPTATASTGGAVQPSSNESSGGGSQEPGPGAGPASVSFRFPTFGGTFTNGQDATGTVKGAPPGSQVWLLVGLKDAATRIPEGPCTISGTSWTCKSVQLPAGGNEYSLLAVLVPRSEVAALRAATSVTGPPTGQLALDNILTYS